MAYRWPTDPPGKPPAHTISWQQHQATLAAVNREQGLAQHQGAVNAARVPAAPPKGLPAGTPQPQAAAPAAGPAAGARLPVKAGAIVPDAQYLAEAAQKAFLRTQQLGALTQESQDDKTNTQTAINRLLENAVSDRVKINEGANKEGLFYSGQLTKRLGDYETQVERAKGDATTLLGQREASRLLQRNTIEQGGPLDDAVLLALAGQRQTGRDTTAADSNALVPNLGGSANAPQSTAINTVLGYTVQPKKNSKGQAGELHVYPDGRRVWVPKKR